LGWFFIWGEILSNNKWELRQDTIQENDYSITIASYVRRKNTDEDWMYAGTCIHYADGTNEYDMGECE
jgi:hypothetical protein